VKNEITLALSGTRTPSIKAVATAGGCELTLGTEKAQEVTENRF
jgi:hypothetical protein